MLRFKTRETVVTPAMVLATFWRRLGEGLGFWEEGETAQHLTIRARVLLVAGAAAEEEGVANLRAADGEEEEERLVGVR